MVVLNATNSQSTAKSFFQIGHDTHQLNGEPLLPCRHTHM